jgi:hypothetical protein
MIIMSDVKVNIDVLMKIKPIIRPALYAIPNDGSISSLFFVFFWIKGLPCGFCYADVCEKCNF